MTISAEEHKRRHEVARRVVAEGGSAEALAKELGMSVGRAREVAYDARVSFKRRARLDHPGHARAIELLLQGKSPYDVAQEVGVSTGCVWHWARKAGIKRRRSRGAKISTVTFDVLAEVFHHPEQTDMAIACKVGCNHERVGQLRAMMRDKQIVKS